VPLSLLLVPLLLLIPGASASTKMVGSGTFTATITSATTLYSNGGTTLFFQRPGCPHWNRDRDRHGHILSVGAPIRSRHRRWELRLHIVHLQRTTRHIHRPIHLPGHLRRFWHWSRPTHWFRHSSRPHRSRHLHHHHHGDRIHRSLRSRIPIRLHSLTSQS
jgi:hypothetical protein